MLFLCFNLFLFQAFLSFDCFPFFFLNEIRRFALLDIRSFLQLKVYQLLFGRFRAVMGFFYFPLSVALNLTIYQIKKTVDVDLNRWYYIKVAAADEAYEHNTKKTFQKSFKKLLTLNQQRGNI